MNYVYTMHKVKNELRNRSNSNFYYAIAMVEEVLPRKLSLQSSKLLDKSQVLSVRGEERAEGELILLTFSTGT